MSKKDKMVLKRIHLQVYFGKNVKYLRLLIVIHF